MEAVGPDVRERYSKEEIKRQEVSMDEESLTVKNAFQPILFYQPACVCVPASIYTACMNVCS